MSFDHFHIYRYIQYRPNRPRFPDHPELAHLKPLPVFSAKPGCRLDEAAARRSKAEQGVCGKEALSRPGGNGLSPCLSIWHNRARGAVRRPACEYAEASLPVTGDSAS